MMLEIAAQAGNFSGVSPTIGRLRQLRTTTGMFLCKLGTASARADKPTAGTTAVKSKAGLHNYTTVLPGFSYAQTRYTRKGCSFSPNARTHFYNVVFEEENTQWLTQRKSESD